MFGISRPIKVACHKFYYMIDGELSCDEIHYTFFRCVHCVHKEVVADYWIDRLGELDFWRFSSYRYVIIDKAWIRKYKLSK